MPPYVKRQNTDVIWNGWSLENGDGDIIAYLDTELMADGLLFVLLDEGTTRARLPEYPIDVPLGDGEPEADADEAEVESGTVVGGEE